MSVRLGAMHLVVLMAAVINMVAATEFFKESFSDASWSDRWVVSSWKKSEGTNGAWKWTAGLFPGDEQANKGIQTSQDARFYAVSADAGASFANDEKTPFVIQFSVKHEQKLDCGGGYIKVMPDGIDQATFSGSTDYSIMFGPDICGHGTKKVHAIINYNGVNHELKEKVECKTDQLTHVYTFILNPDQTYQIRVDGEVKQEGKIEDGWDLLPPKKIKDPSVSKPKDWVDVKKIEDPTHKKPENYDELPDEIEDPEAVMPEDWDEESDGAWVAPMIPNPEKQWTPKMIDNPEYKGEWVHPLVDNPDYSPVSNLHIVKGRYIGFELWQVKSGSIFDDIIITDSVAAAEQLMADTWTKTKDAEKKNFDSYKAKQAKEAEEARKAEEEARKAEEVDEEEEEEDDDDRDEL